MSVEGWRDFALCAGSDPAIFYSTSEEVQALAAVQCIGCPVRVACLEYALVRREDHGVWGGATEWERRTILRRAKRRRELGHLTVHASTWAAEDARGVTVDGVASAG